MNSKVCERCGRTMEYRKKWARNWDQVKYCSERCRRNKVSDNFEEQILDLLKARGRGKTICPSEILPFENKQNPEQMERVRQAARRFADQGKIEITQKNQVVDPREFRGPIRLRLNHME
jgi:hypothetical protein